MKAGFLLLFFFLTASALYSQWIELDALPGQSLWASSSFSETLGGQVHTYGPEALFDGDMATPWVEGASDEGIGEDLIILANRAVTGISLNNGFARSPSLYEKNNRLKAMNLSILIGFTAPGMVSETDSTLYLLKEFDIDSGIEVSDTSETQFFEITLSPEEQMELCREVLESFTGENPFFLKMMREETGLALEDFNSDMDLLLMMEIYGFLALKLTIQDVYRGSRYNDSCLSEISLQLEDF
ncbi:MULTISPECIES: hypothetical protein [unclassified Oceanispirochaeta]|uniref:NADase-type glycan-binding domain-containing protein n=1 Tax=unclassified Oceanispirochaeta TaxID=2635722 RepID=UPI000E09A2C4|nr:MULTISPECIES: hypothetical protein [unclassified Oceanispirochaeta]MBF9018014.1 hypothetical protein [Oceanispirochaeta sp. M2]NPD74526.1 hypothetical protein [Oceanispirochaeta sp. M1]RDG29638.1 hypothetical protein DV872_20700 [Oceanispirochaeta sp. M1]